MSCMNFEPPKYLGCPIYQCKLEQKIIEDFINKHAEKLNEMLEVELLQIGIKGKLTKGKMKWHGIKLLVDNHLEYSKYKIIQRGKLVKSFTISYE